MTPTTNSKARPTASRSTPALSTFVVVSFTVLALMAGSSLIAQAPAGTQTPSAQTPVFRSSVRLIDVDVYVTDQQGRPIKGLTRDDFELLEDNKPQEVRAFTPIDLPVDVPGTSASNEAAKESRLPPPDVSTNVDIGRTYVLLLDSPYMQMWNEFVTGAAYTAAVKRVATQFIREALGPRDQMAVVHVQGTTSAAQGLTSNTDLLLASIAKYGQGQSGGESAPEAGNPEIAQRILASYRAIQDISERLAVIGGRRKTIVWIGGQLPFEFTGSYDTGGTPPRSITKQFVGLITAAHKDALRAATRNNVAIFPVDPTGLSTDTADPMTPGQGSGGRNTLPRPPETVRLAALREVAEETGGSAVVGTNNFSGGYSRIVQENSTYYIVGYSPAEEYQDGKFHGIRVRVKNRPELLVHARRGYTAPDGTAKPVASTPLPDGVSIAARDALRSPAPVSGLAIELASAVFKASPTEGAVVLDAQVRGSLDLDAGARVTISYQVIDTDGKIVTGAYKGFGLDLKDQTRKQVLASGFRFVDRLTLKPGRYELRFVADQPGSDTLGSVVTHVEVPEFNDTLSMSGVLIGSLSTWEHRTLHSDEESKKQVSVDPTAVRRFPRGDELSVYVELYQRPDRAGDLDVTASVVSREGKVVLKEEAMALDGASSGRAAFRAQLGLGDLSPGVYVLRVEGASSRDGVDPVRRQLPFTVVED